MPPKNIVSGYARMWPREVFGLFGNKTMAKGLEFLTKAGVYILYRDDTPYYTGQATKLRTRLRMHAAKAESRYFHFWNFFSAFAVSNPSHRDELEGILIAAMPTANSAKPKLQREKMPKEVTLLPACLVLLIACQPALGRHQDSEYKTGTLISWGAGGVDCSGVSLGKSVSVGRTSCNPGGNTSYQVTIDGHQYQLTVGDVNGGIFDRNPDPLRSLLPSDKFQCRTDSKNKKLWVVGKNGQCASVYPPCTSVGRF